MPEMDAQLQQWHAAEAERLKKEGNECFTKQKFRAAIEKYTQALDHTPEWDVLYVNRANCNKQLQLFEAVESDSAQALKLNKSNLKAHYFLGLALFQRQQYEEAIDHLEKALELARDKGDSMKDDIWAQLARTKYAQWELLQTKRITEKRELQQYVGQLQSLLQGQYRTQLASCQTSAEKAQVEAQYQLDKERWEDLFGRVDISGPGMVDQDAAVCCPLTMAVYREPVVTRAGHSYERSALQEHFSKVGYFDPITRGQLLNSDVFPNHAMRSAVKQYLEDHPWAWKECF